MRKESPFPKMFIGFAVLWMVFIVAYRIITGDYPFQEVHEGDFWYISITALFGAILFPFAVITLYVIIRSILKLFR